MKMHILLFFIILIYQPLFSQNIQGRVTYHKILDFSSDKELSKDSCVLYFNSEQSLFIEKPELDKPVSDGKVLEVPEASFKMDFSSLEKSTSYFKNIALKKIYDECFDKKYHYYVEDTMHDFGWTITAETKKIGVYDCMKAISNDFRGRVYEAWFTYLIPNSTGPWKLGGLPGLILEASDQKGEVNFMFTSLQIPNQDKVNYEVPKNLEFKNWEEHVKTQKKALKDMLNYYKSLGATVSIDALNFIEYMDFGLENGEK